MKENSFWNRYGKVLILFFGIAVLFLFLYSFSTSPLTPHSWGSDSAYFQLEGQLQAHGWVPYRDIFDTKGPSFSFIQWLGSLLGGRYGLFVFQVLNLTLFLVIADATCRLLCPDRKARVFTCLLSLFLLSVTIDGGNLTEEYSLMPLLFCQYLYVKYKMCREEHPYFYAFLYGCVFSFTAMTRFTNGFLIGCIVLAVMIDLIRGRKWKRLAIHAGVFLGGMCLTILPFFLFYKTQGALGDMIYATLTFSFRYATDSSSGFRWTLLLPMLLLAAVGWYASWRRRRGIVIYSMISVAVLMLVLLLGFAFIHYYQLIIPVFLLVCWLLPEKWLTSVKWCALLLALIVLVNIKLLAMHTGRIVVAAGMDTPAREKTVLGTIAHSIEHLDTYGQGTYGYVAYDYVNDLLEQIPSADRDKVFSYNTKSQWNLLCGLDPYCRYFVTADGFSMMAPEISEDIVTILKERPPAYIVSEGIDRIRNEQVKTLIQTNYKKKYQNGFYELYELLEN